MSGRLDDSFKQNNSPDVFIDDIEHNVMGMLVRASVIEWTLGDLKRLRAAITSLDAIAARAERKLNK